MASNDLPERVKDEIDKHPVNRVIYERIARIAAEEAARIAANKWPRGSAHTYASENADRYIALEDASEVIANDIKRAFGIGK